MNEAIEAVADQEVDLNARDGGETPEPLALEEAPSEKKQKGDNWLALLWNKEGLMVRESAVNQKELKEKLSVYPAEALIEVWRGQRKRLVAKTKTVYNFGK